MTKASCPGCGKVVAVAGPSSDIAGRLLRHREPGAGRMCPRGGKHRALKRELIHPCARCAELPELGAVPWSPQWWRPEVPRPVTGGTLKLCATHRREHVAALKTGAADRQRTRRFGVTRAEWHDLIAAQGGGCACGLPHATSKRRLVADHDHDREAECVRLGRHPAGRACTHCVRGALGTQCNQVVVGRFTSAQLRNLADYQDHPTAERLGWWDETDDEQETGT